METPRPKKLALMLLIASLSASAAIAIVALVVGRFGDLQIRVIGTSFSFTLGSILALSCAVQIERKRFVWYSLAGVVLAVVAVALSIYGIWWEPRRPHLETFLKTVFSAWVVAGATSHGCVLLLATLARRYRWALVSAITCGYVLATMLLAMMWLEIDSSPYYRFLGVVCVLFALLSILVPILHRASVLDANVMDPDTAPVVGSDHVFCPRCGFRQIQSSAEVECTSCSTVFVVAIIREAGRRGE